MKKFTFMLALVATLATGFTFISCGSDSSDDALGIDNEQKQTNTNDEKNEASTDGISYLYLGWGSTASQVKSYMASFSDFELQNSSFQTSVIYKKGNLEVGYTFGSYKVGTTWEDNLLRCITINESESDPETWTQFFTSNCNAQFTYDNKDELVGKKNYSGTGKFNGHSMTIYITHSTNYGTTSISIMPLQD